MKIINQLAILLFLIVFFGCELSERSDSYRILEKKFENPPIEAKLRAYWLWLNGNVTEKAITRDLEAMKTKGFGGAVLCDMDRSYVRGNKQVPHGPDFMSSEWRALYRHALEEASRLGLELSLNITSGWALGGPMVKMEDAPKVLTWSKESVKGPASFKNKLALPDLNQFNTVLHRAHEKAARVLMDSLYQDVYVVAYPKNNTAKIRNWEIKGLHKPMHHSAPSTGALFDNILTDTSEVVIGMNEVIDLSGNLSANGILEWEFPEGEWEILRLGYTTYSKGVKWSSSQGWEGFPIDVFDAEIMDKYWNMVVDPLISDAGALAGKTLNFLHTDSWELEPINWTPTFPEEFNKRRGYDLTPFIPVLVGNVVQSREISNRFLHDFRKTFGDLVIDNHYKIFKDNAHLNGLEIHPESGGPHAVPIDAQRCLGFNDIPMSEFWAKSWTHRVTDEQRFFVKQPASAAHTYGHNIVMAEGFTTIGPHWQETIWDNLKPTFDKAACEGMNQLVWHAFSCSPADMGVPGQDFFAGTHFNSNVTWWSRSEAFLSYINKCQAMLQHGRFVADVVYYYGDHVPNFARLQSSDPCNVLPGYDYDVVTEEVILERMDVSDGKIVLPGGMHYSILVIPEYPGFSLLVLKKIKKLLHKGAIVVGPKPEYVNGLMNYPDSDEEFIKLVNELWGNSYAENSVLEKRIGKGYLFAGIQVKKVLNRFNIHQDFSFDSNSEETEIDYIHRSDSIVDVYFVSNQNSNSEEVTCSFRVSGRQPEFWDPVTGNKWYATNWSVENGRTIIPLELAPYGSLFIVFYKKADPPGNDEKKNNFIQCSLVKTLEGDWEVSFNEKWGDPHSVIFDELKSWTEHSENGIKYFSGTSTYKKSFEYQNSETSADTKIFIDLGNVRELAEIRLNGKQLGIVWSPPFRVEITDFILPGENKLEVDVVNFWPNRIIGDQLLPSDQRYTKTNINVFTAESALMPSGLMGPVTLLQSVN